MQLKEIKSFIEGRKKELRALSDDIWKHPEVAYTEKYAVARVAEFMKGQGYEITTPYCGIETAFRCEYGAGDGPVFAFASEYDALPEAAESTPQGFPLILRVYGFCISTRLR